MESEHLKDYVWMQLGGEQPIQVPATEEHLTPKLAAGYRQLLDEPTQLKQEPE